MDRAMDNPGTFIAKWRKAHSDMPVRRRGMQVPGPAAAEWASWFKPRFGKYDICRRGFSCVLLGCPGGSHAPVVQWIGFKTPNLETAVRLCPGVLNRLVGDNHEKKI